jgi:hypothetical protein
VVECNCLEGILVQVAGLFFAPMRPAKASPGFFVVYFIIDSIGGLVYRKIDKYLKRKEGESNPAEFFGS